MVGVGACGRSAPVTLMIVRAVSTPGFSSVHHLADLSIGLDAWIAVRNLPQGRAFGGIRIRAYPTDEAALCDALALSAAMAAKLAFAGLDEGGCKTVIRLRPDTDRAAAVRAVAEHIEGLAGVVWCGPDLGFGVADDAVLRAATGYVGCHGLGDAAGRGVALTIAGTLDALGRSVSGATVLIQGGGAVGAPAREHLEALGASTRVSDLVAERSDLDPAALWITSADVLAPCAVGGVLTADRCAVLEVRAVVPGANNALASREVADLLHLRGITYVPDFVAMAGAALLGVLRTLGQDSAALAAVEAMRARARTLVASAAAEGVSPLAVAEAEVRARLGSAAE